MSNSLNSDWFKNIFPDAESDYCEIVSENVETITIPDSQDNHNETKNTSQDQDNEIFANSLPNKDENNDVSLKRREFSASIEIRSLESPNLFQDIEINNTTNADAEMNVQTIDGNRGLEKKIVENEKIKVTKAARISQAKKNRNAGKEYVSTKTKKVVPARELKLFSSCKFSCKNKITIEEQRQLFEEYWQLGSYVNRIAYINKLINITPKKRATNLLNPKKIRSYTIEYKVIIGLKSITLCKTCFLCVFGETTGFIRSVKDKVVKKTAFKDNRGEKTSQRRKISETRVEEVKNHIMSFPAYESHYGRSHSKKKYLGENLNLSKMYNLYKEKCSNSLVSLTKYRQIFNKMNLKFKKPQIDSCSKCDKLALQIKSTENDETKAKLIEEQQKHHDYANVAYNSKRMDKADNTKTVLCMDLQQCLPTPFLKSSIAFYKRKLWTFNLTIRNCSSNETRCFMWNESQSGRGANEIASCLWKYFEQNENLQQHVIIYSDTCAGQNRNNIVSAMMMLVMKKDTFNVQKIEHKFLEPGHTHLECDSDHSVIERKKKQYNLGIYHPHDWCQLVRSCSTKKHLFVVTEMTTTDFFNFSSLYKTLFKKAQFNTDGTKVKWNEIRTLIYSKSYNFGEFFYKTKYNGEEYTVKCLKYKNFNQHSLAKYCSGISNLYYSIRPISEQKKKDLLQLLSFVPSVFHEFYRQLKTNKEEQDIDYDIYSSAAEDLE